MQGLFVTGTDTGVGKTVLAAAIVAALRARGAAPLAFKPVITGLDDPSDPSWPPDHELLGRAAGRAAEDVALIGYGPSVSPHLAAELSARPIDPQALIARVRAAAAPGGPVIVEGVGGLLVPLAEGYDVRRFAQALGLPVVIAARPGLGTINHTLLTLEAARQAPLEAARDAPLEAARDAPLEAARDAPLRVAGVVLTPWPREPSTIEHSNRETIERLGGVTVSTLPQIARADLELLASAGAQLPIDRWLG